ncbi:MAG: UMP kinase [Spirochaetales bacterium]|jgi:uridylate kinase|nr:UMP kinase [Spirochaetales bacterium]
MGNNNFDTKVLDLGGSLVAPDEIALDFLKSFRDLVTEYLKEDDSRRLILVIGGGGLARKYQSAYREISSQSTNDEADWIGIGATKLNARLVKGVFQEFCLDEVVSDPTDVPAFTGRILVASGWKPGFSTDYDAVLLAERFGASVLVNLTNIPKVYTADPKADPNAQPLDEVTWADFRKITGDEWVPGKNTPFDPSAAKKGSEMKLTVISVLGTNLNNFRKVLFGGDYVGTTVGPE